MTTMLTGHFRNALTILFFISLSLNAIQAQVSVTAELDSTYMLIGDRMNIKLRLSFPPSVSSLKVDLANLEKDEHIEVHQKGKIDTLDIDQYVRTQQNISFTILDSGAFIVPPIIVHFQQNGSSSTQQSNDLLVNVLTPKVTDAEPLAPIRPIHKEPLNFWDVLPWLLGLLFTIALIWFLYRFFKKKDKKEKPKVIIRKIPAHETALQQLEALRQKQLWQNGKIKEYQSELTHILREYLEGRYGIQALESTTSEIQQQLQNLHFDQNMKQDLTQLLQVADMVKFAKAQPPEDFHDKVLEQVKNFILKTKPTEIVEQYVDGDGNLVDPETGEPLVDQNHSPQRDKK